MQTKIFGNSWKRLTLSAMLLAGSAWAGFDACKFNFGMGWTGEATNYSGIDHITIWVGGDETFNVYWQGRMLEKAVAVGATPVYYGYVIGELGHRTGLKDCDVAGGGASLCTGGANLIRTQRAKILSIYSHYAQKSAEIVGANSDMIWLIEPDFYQYSAMGGSKQDGGGIPNADMGVLFKDIVSTIRQHLPKARISIDISPWITNQASWYANFDLSQVQFAHTSGGRTEANNTRIRTANATTWASIRQVTGKPIIADDGYGVGGASIGHDATWDDVNNLKARITDGVIGISQNAARADYPTSLATLRTQLSGLVSCGSTPSSSSVVVPSSSSVKPSSSSVVQPSSSSVKPSSSSSVPPSSSSITQSSSSATVTSLPGRLEAESYATMNGLELGASNDDATPCIGYIDNGDWASYSLQVTSAGSYNVKVRAASGGTGGSVVLKLGSTTLATIAITSTGGWSNWLEFQGTVQLPAGAQTLRAEFTGQNGGLFNVNWFDFHKEGTSSSSSQPSSSSQGSSSSTQSSSSSVIPGGSLVRNGDFGQGTKEWNLQVNSPSGASGTILDVDGRLFLNVSWGGGAPGDLIVQQENVVLPAQELRLQFKVSTAEFQGGRNLAYRITNVTQTYCDKTGLALTEEIQTVDCLFTPAAGTYSVQFLAGGAFWQDVLLDDVWIGPSGSAVTGILPLPRHFVEGTVWVNVAQSGSLRSVAVPMAWNQGTVDVIGIHGRVLRSFVLQAGAIISLDGLPLGSYWLRKDQGTPVRCW